MKTKNIKRILITPVYLNDKRFYEINMGKEFEILTESDVINFIQTLEKMIV